MHPHIVRVMFVEVESSLTHIAIQTAALQCCCRSVVLRFPLGSSSGSLEYDFNVENSREQHRTVR